MPRAAMDYSKTNIYKIVCNDLTIKECYVGHTINMTERKCAHKSRCHNEKDKNHNHKKYKIIRENGGWDNWTMLLVEKFPCENKREAEKKEREVYEELDAKLNMVRPYLAQEERKEHKKQNHKQYYQEHKEVLAEKHKQYREDHKEEQKQQKKQYYQEHKAELDEKFKEKIECEYCSKQLQKGNMTRHHKICKSKGGAASQ